MDNMPQSFKIWDDALKCTDKDPSRVKKGLVDPGYHIPEPTLLISALSPECHQLIMTNRLTIHLLWISHLNHDPPTRFLTPQQRRETLHSVPSREELEATPTRSKGHGSAKGCKLVVPEAFGEEVTAMMQGSYCTLKEEVQ